jgi:hypothetical protein
LGYPPDVHGLARRVGRDPGIPRFPQDDPRGKSGRYIIFIDDEIICADGKLWDDQKQTGYREIPLYRMAGRELWGSPWGYSRAFDVLPLQETVDRLASAVATNQLTFATQNILIPKGSSISWENLYGGLNVIEWDASMGEAGIPKALQLTSTPKEVFDNIARTVTTMGTIMGINEVLRGNPDLALKGQISGASLALMTSATASSSTRICKRRTCGWRNRSARRLSIVSRTSRSRILGTEKRWSATA